MNDSPLVSFIVLSYNYERFIERALRSILDQTVQDFEIVVVDDASVDGSVDRILAIDDKRIRLLCNEKNMGGAASYNRAVSEARGVWLANLDADDWIDPRKTECQLEHAKDDHLVDIIGTYVSFFDENGLPHPDSYVLEQSTNRAHDFNLVDTWIGANHLCRSSTMVRAASHRRIGLDDASMIRAPDYELWTRALRMGCRFAIVPERLTCVRLHARGVTHADPRATLLEMSYAKQRNLLPLAEARSLLCSISRMISWAGNHPSLTRLLPSQRYRLLGMLMLPTEVDDFAHYAAVLSEPAVQPSLAGLGRRALVLVGPDYDSQSEMFKLLDDVKAYIAAKEFFRAEAQKWEHLYREAVRNAARVTVSAEQEIVAVTEHLSKHNAAGSESGSADQISKLLGDIKAYIEAREYHRGQSEEWERRYQELAAYQRDQSSGAAVGGIRNLGCIATCRRACLRVLRLSRRLVPARSGNRAQ